VAKVADFGLSRTLSSTSSKVVTNTYGESLSFLMSGRGLVGHGAGGGGGGAVFFCFAL
jgi:hypothetical protein